MWSDEDDFLDGVDLDAIDPGAPAAGAPAAAGGAPLGKRKPPPSEGLAPRGKKPRQQSASACGCREGDEDDFLDGVDLDAIDPGAPAAGGAGGGGRRAGRGSGRHRLRGLAPWAKARAEGASAFGEFGGEGDEDDFLDGVDSTRRSPAPLRVRRRRRAARWIPEAEGTAFGVWAAGAKKPGPKSANALMTLTTGSTWM